ncbi:hypothetical protein IL306_014081 [Fusarium sp. DS 682]|nr:hypothetical protein IL306_014081 [Fusarium sp. DS 682]
MRTMIDKFKAAKRDPNEMWNEKSEYGIMLQAVKRTPSKGVVQRIFHQDKELAAAFANREYPPEAGLRVALGSPIPEGRISADSSENTLRNLEQDMMLTASDIQRYDNYNCGIFALAILQTLFKGQAVPQEINPREHRIAFIEKLKTVSVGEQQEIDGSPISPTPQSNVSYGPVTPTRMPLSSTLVGDAWMPERMENHDKPESNSMSRALQLRPELRPQHGVNHLHELQRDSIQSVASTRNGQLNVLLSNPDFSSGGPKVQDMLAFHKTFIESRKKVQRELKLTKVRRDDQAELVTRLCRDLKKEEKQLQDCEQIVWVHQTEVQSAEAYMQRQTNDNVLLPATMAEVRQLQQEMSRDVLESFRGQLKIAEAMRHNQVVKVNELKRQIQRETTLQNDIEVWIHEMKKRLSETCIHNEEVDED